MARSTDTRIAAARNRAATANKALAVSAAALFAAVLVGARLSHPGQAAAAPAGTTAVDQASQGQSFDFGQSNIGPAAGSSGGSTGSTHAS